MIFENSEIKAKRLVFTAGYLSGRGGTEVIMSAVLNMLADQYHIDFVLGYNYPNVEWLTTISSSVRIRKSASIKKVWHLFYFLSLLSAVFRGNRLFIATDSEAVAVLSFLRDHFFGTIKILSWYHFLLPEDIRESRLSPLLKADGHLVLSSDSKSRLMKSGVNQSVISTVYNPCLEYGKMTIPRSKSVVPRLLFIGRASLDGQKNLRILFQALTRTRLKIMLDIFGNSEDDKELYSYVHELGLDDRVIFHGWVDQVWSRVSCTDALVLTSKIEGFPMVVLEALGYGVPVICPNIGGGTNDCVSDEKNGLVYEADNLEDLTRVLDEISDFRSISSETVRNSVFRFSKSQYYINFVQAIEKNQHSRSVCSSQ